jgi:hypothetical protein
MKLEEFRVYLEDIDSHFRLLGIPDFNELTIDVYHNIITTIHRNTNIWVWTTTPTELIELRGAEIIYQLKYPMQLFDAGKRFIKNTKKVLERDEIVRNYIEVLVDIPERLECRVCYEKFDPPTAEKWQNMTLMKFRVYLDEMSLHYLDDKSASSWWISQFYAGVLNLIRKGDKGLVWTFNQSEYIEERGAKEIESGRTYIESLKEILEQDEMLHKFLEIVTATPDRIECRLRDEKFEPYIPPHL